MCNFFNNEPNIFEINCQSSYISYINIHLEKKGWSENWIFKKLFYSIQYYVVKFVSDLQRVGGFLRVLRFAPPIKLTATILLKYWWRWR